MSETLKEKVLAKCYGLAPNDGDSISVVENKLAIDKEVIDSDINEWTLYGDYFKYSLATDIPETDFVWPLAAKILGIEDDQAKADREAILIEFANGLERKLIDSYCTGDAISAIKRLCGMEVGNG